MSGPAADELREVEDKAARVRAILRAEGLDAIVLRRVSSFAWATAGGASYVNAATDLGEAALVVTRDDRIVVTNDIEAPRLAAEQGLARQGWRMIASPWLGGIDGAIAAETRGLAVGSDAPARDEVDLRVAVARLRAALRVEETRRFRDVGRRCAAAMAEAVQATSPGQTEHEIAGHMTRSLVRRGVLPIVTQVAVDARVFAYRHALPTGAVLAAYAMLSFCGRRRGLVCSLSRLVHFGALPLELSRKEEAVARVDAALLDAAVPGARLRDLFAVAVSAYAELGFDGEWRLHHQGGVAGYEPRELLALPTSDEVLSADQVVAFNPTIRGTKSEDTACVGAAGAEPMTEMDGWPTLAVEGRHGVRLRPRVLVIR